MLKACKECVREGECAIKDSDLVPTKETCSNCKFQELCGVEALHIDTACPHWQMKFAEETDPNGKSLNEPGAKADAGKPMASLLSSFGLALMAIAEVSTFGAKKYTRNGWESVPNGRERYLDAKWRHLLKGNLEEKDPESGLLHESHELWNCLAALELKLREQAMHGSQPKR